MGRLLVKKSRADLILAGFYTQHIRCSPCRNEIPQTWLFSLSRQERALA